MSKGLAGFGKFIAFIVFCIIYVVYKDVILSEEVTGIVKNIIVVTVLVLSGVGFTTFMERKILAFMQLRIGPARVGCRGLLQPIADGIKLVTKECILPAGSDKWIFIAAPIVSLAFALVSFAVIPFTPNFYLADLNIGALYVLAMGSMGFYGMIMAGWSSGNKYSHLGSMRAIAQMLSYEVPMVLSLIGVFILARSMNLRKIVEAQASAGWFVFQQPMAFIVYLLSGIAETARLPFDLPEGEGELVGGFHTEYSGIRFGLLFMAEYANMFMVSLIASILFLGGWLRPLPGVSALAFLNYIPPIIWLLVKVFTFIFIYIWLRATLLRPQYDRLMFLSWKVLVPLSFINILITSAFSVLDTQSITDINLSHPGSTGFLGNFLLYAGLIVSNIVLSSLWLKICKSKTTL